MKTLLPILLVLFLSLHVSAECKTYRDERVENYSELPDVFIDCAVEGAMDVESDLAPHIAFLIKIAFVFLVIMLVIGGAVRLWGVMWG